MRKGPNYVLGFAVVCGLAAAVMGGFWLKDRLERRAAEGAARTAWAETRAMVDARLNDDFPLELGAVWATHSGRICGLVNGGSSFGGLTGMIPFYREGDRVLYSINTPQPAFSPGWRECMGDAWLELHPGSYATGFCATRRGATRCKTVGGERAESPSA